MTLDPPDQVGAAGLQVRGGADAVEMAALLASLAQLQRRRARRRRPPTGWRATRLAALGLTGRSG